MNRPLATGLLVYLLYFVVIFSAWALADVDYTNLVASDVIVSDLLMPLVAGAVFLTLALGYLNWWRPVFHEAPTAKPRWALIVMLLPMAGFIISHLVLMDWGFFGAGHLLVLIVSALLVGFNEEVLTRGFVLVGARNARLSEVWVWLMSSALFGLMHLPNVLYGLPLVGGVVQVFLAFMAGSGLYLLRRLSGTLLLPIFAHAAWDFSTFAHMASESPQYPVFTVFQIGTYLVSLILVVTVLRTPQVRAAA